MRRTGLLLFGLMLAISSAAAAAKDCSERFAVKMLTAETAQTTGTSDTWRDLLARLVADVESLDLDQGDEATTLTWNVASGVDAQAVVWKKPPLFGPLAEALAANDDERDELSGRIHEGDDWEVSLTAHVGLPNGGAPKSRGFAGYYRALATSVGNVAPMAVSATGMDCDRMMAALPQEAFEAAGRQMRDANNRPRELSFRGFARERRVVVGPDQKGLTIKYSFGMPVGNSNAGGAPVENRLAAVIEPFLNQVALEKVTDKATLNDARRTIAELAQGVTPETATFQHRFAFEGEWLRVEDYQFPLASGSSLTLPKEESIIAKASYSLQMTRDADTDPATPLIEFAASYEDVDGDAQRQQRLLASVKTVLRVSALGKDSDLTLGLHYASKPEYLVLGEDDRGLTARMAMTFKIGAPPSGATKAAN